MRLICRLKMLFQIRVQMGIPFFFTANTVKEVVPGFACSRPFASILCCLFFAAGEESIRANQAVICLLHHYDSHTMDFIPSRLVLGNLAMTIVTSPVLFSGLVEFFFIRLSALPLQGYTKESTAL